MESVLLTEDNIENFKDFVDEDMAENIGRSFYHGIIVTDGSEPVAGMIWIYLNTWSDESKVSRIVWLKTESRETFDLLFEEYNECVSEADIVRSEVYLPAKTGRFEKQALRDIGFKIGLTEGDVISARLSEVAEIGFIKNGNYGDDIYILRTATQRGFDGAISRLTKKGHTGIYEDIAFLPRLYFENDVSCYSEENDTINGLFLCHRTPSGMLEVVLMSATGKDPVKSLCQMIIFACENALEKYDPDTKVIINRHNYSSLALGEKLFPTGFGIPMYEGSRDER